MQSGFRKSGIITLDRSQVLNVLPREDNNEHAHVNVDNAVENLLNHSDMEMQHCQDKKRKKVPVQAGQSVMGQPTNDKD